MGSNTEQYCLRWNDFQSNITGAFSDIRDDEDFLDVTLVCDGQTVKAHKLVLSACSPLFRTMLKKNTHPQPMIFLHGVRYADISAILNFMYHGEVNVNQEDLQTFLAAAEELRIRGLSDKSAVDNNSNSHQNSPKRFKSDTYSQSNSNKKQTEITDPSIISNTNVASSAKKKKGNLVITPDMPPVTEYHDNSSSQSESYFGYDGGSGTNLNLYGGQQQSSGRSRGVKDEENGLVVCSPSSVRSGGSQYSYYELGGRDTDDPLARMRVARSVQGWHCPQCIHVATTKGNLKSHILSGRHKLTEKSFQCQFCSKHYSTKQSLQVHISTNHRIERDYQEEGSMSVIEQDTSRDSSLHQHHLQKLQTQQSQQLGEEEEVLPLRDVQDGVPGFSLSRKDPMEEEEEEDERNLPVRGEPAPHQQEQTHQPRDYGIKPRSDGNLLFRNYSSHDKKQEVSVPNIATAAPATTGDDYSNALPLNMS